jgi:hypothetical protein
MIYTPFSDLHPLMVIAGGAVSARKYGNGNYILESAYSVQSGLKNV